MENLNNTNGLNFGAMTISLDFELHWGLRDIVPVEGVWRENLLGEVRAVPELLNLFKEFDVSATWATVGLLFADSKKEIKEFTPKVLPEYDKRKLFPYDEPIGETEDEDPFHYASRLIRLIRQTPRQEVSTHTFSHYYCLEPGQTKKAFEADLQSAMAIAEKKYGIKLSSIVFPRNQHNPDYEDVLVANGINCLRGNQRKWMYRLSDEGKTVTIQRAGKLYDTYFSLAGHHTFGWNEVWENPRIANVRASCLIRPVTVKIPILDRIRLRRIKKMIEYAAIRKQIVHLWCHPYELGVNLEENIAFFRKVLTISEECRKKYGLKSLTMSEVAEMSCPQQLLET